MQEPPNETPRRSTWTAWRVSQWYCWMSTLGALLAILIAPSSTNLMTTPVTALPAASSSSSSSSTLLPEETATAATHIEFPLWRWMTQFLPPPEMKQAPITCKEDTSSSPWWERFLSTHEAVDAACANTTQRDTFAAALWRLAILRWIDPAVLPPISNIDTLITDLIDKVLTSSLRILAIANWLIALTVLLHTAVADAFLGPRASAPSDASSFYDRPRGFLFFKFLLIAAMVAPDTFDLLILLSWYTVLSFLRSLAALCAQQTERARRLLRTPGPGVGPLLTWVLVGDALAALTCWALFHGAGYSMVLLLTGDCLLLALEAITNWIQYYQARGDGRYATQVRLLEEQEEPSEYEMEVLEQQHDQTSALLDTMVFYLQLWTDFTTTAHYLHIWTLHGLHFTFIDGVIGLHLHASIMAACQKLAARRARQRVAREMDALFANASDTDLRNATAAGDVCCICLGSMMMTGASPKERPVKKMTCGHLYHTACLRQVMERSRSLESARCPLCRAFFVPRKEETPAAEAEAEVERALFRFTTDGLLPRWIPLPAFSLEVVRRPLVPEEHRPDDAALEQLVDLFPQYDRGDLQRAVRERGSMDAVVESILLGTFVGMPPIGDGR